MTEDIKIELPVAEVSVPAKRGRKPGKAKTDAATLATVKTPRKRKSEPVQELESFGAEIDNVEALANAYTAADKVADGTETVVFVVSVSPQGGSVYLASDEAMLTSTQIVRLSTASASALVSFVNGRVAEYFDHNKENLNQGAGLLEGTFAAPKAPKGRPSA